MTLFACLLPVLVDSAQVRSHSSRRRTSHYTTHARSRTSRITKRHAQRSRATRKGTNFMLLAKLRAMSALKIGVVIHTSGQAQQRTVGVSRSSGNPTCRHPHLMTRTSYEVSLLKLRTGYRTAVKWCHEHKYPTPQGAEQNGYRTSPERSGVRGTVRGQ